MFCGTVLTRFTLLSHISLETRLVVGHLLLCTVVTVMYVSVLPQLGFDVEFDFVIPMRKQDSNQPVAIKAVIRSKLTTKLLENLESEISILKRITHRYIVELKDCLVRPFSLYLLGHYRAQGSQLMAPFHRTL